MLLEAHLSINPVMASFLTYNSFLSRSMLVTMPGKIPEEDSVVMVVSKKKKN